LITEKLALKLKALELIKDLESMTGMDTPILIWNKLQGYSIIPDNINIYNYDATLARPLTLYITGSLEHVAIGYVQFYFDMEETNDSIRVQ
jgi:hypothetical protein